LVRRAERLPLANTARTFLDGAGKAVVPRKAE
jgi:hypothetical protein